VGRSLVLIASVILGEGTLHRKRGAAFGHGAPNVVSGRAVVSDVAHRPYSHSLHPRFGDGGVRRHHHGRVPQTAVAVDVDGHIRLLQDAELRARVDAAAADRAAVSRQAPRAVGANAAQVRVNQQAGELLGVVGEHAGPFQALGAESAQGIGGNATELCGWTVHTACSSMVDCG